MNDYFEGELETYPPGFQEFILSLVEKGDGDDPAYSAESPAELKARYEKYIGLYELFPLEVRLNPEMLPADQMERVLQAISSLLTAGIRVEEAARSRDIMLRPVSGTPHQGPRR